MHRILCICLLLVLCNSLVSQSVNESFPYTGGYSAFEKDLSSTLFFPTESVKEANYGVLLLQIDTENTGLKSIQVLSLLDRNINEVVRVAVNQTSNKWLSSSEPQTFYQALIFSPGNFNDHLSKNDIAYITTKGSLLKPIEIIGASYTLPASESGKQKSVGVVASGSSGTGSDRDFNQDDTRDFSSGDDLANNPNAISNTPKMANLIKVIKQVDKSIKKGKTEKAYEGLNEYLRYNPLDEERLIQRIELEAELGLSKHKTFDEKLLSFLQSRE